MYWKVWKATGLLLLVIVLLGSILAACSTPAPAPSPSPAPAPAATTAPAPKPSPAPSPSPTAAPTTTAAPKPSATATIKARNLAFSSVNPEPGAYGELCNFFMNQITKQTNGAITFTKYWSASLGAPAAHLKLVQSGTAPVAQFSPGYTPALFPDSDNTFSFPFGPSDPAIAGQAYRTTRAKFPQWEKLYADQNIIFLAASTPAYYNLLSRKPLQTLDDVKGKKVAAMGIYLPKWLEGAGMVGVSMAAPERYTNLQSGLIDVDAMNISQQNSFKIYEVAKYYLECGLGSFPNATIMMNLETFKSFEPQVQDIIIKAGIDAEKYSWQYSKDEKDKVLKVFKDNGVTIATMSQSDINKWVAASPNTVQQQADRLTKEKGLPGTEILKTYYDEVAKLGFKWPRDWFAK